MGLPVWLLDIDGVINAIRPNPDPRVWPRGQWIRASARSAHDLEWPLLAARPVLEFLCRVHHEGRAEIRWHSTWQSHAVNVGAALDLPPWPVAHCPEFAEHLGQIATPLTVTHRPWWKLPAAQRILDEGRPLVWTDDDARLHLHRTDRTGWAGRALVIAPPVQSGLTPHQLRRIDAWLTRRASARPA